MMRLRLVWKSGRVTAVLETTPTADRLVEVLPVSSRAHTWGDEVYFEVPVQAELEPTAVQVVAPGTVCFWVEGRSLAIPFGPTPISRGGECRLVTMVNVAGRLEGDPGILKSIREGERITVELVPGEGDGTQ